MDFNKGIFPISRKDQKSRIGPAELKTSTGLTKGTCANDLQGLALPKSKIPADRPCFPFLGQAAAEGYKATTFQGPGQRPASGKKSALSGGGEVGTIRPPIRRGMRACWEGLALKSPL